MSNDLHDRATRVVAAALVPAFLGIAGLLAWELLPLPVLPTNAVQVEAHRAEAFDVELAAPASPEIAAAVANPAPTVVVPKPVVAPQKPAVVAPPVKTRHCEEYAMYASGDEKVVLCEWE